MFCKNCGSEIKETDKFCEECGCKIDYFDNNQTDDFVNNSIVNDSEPNENLTDSADTVAAVTDMPELTVADKGEASAEKKKPHKYSLPAVVLVIALIFAAFSFSVGFIMHINSDSYKIDKATELVSAGEYSQALDKISDVYTSQSDAIRAYIEVLQAKDDFLNAFNSSVLINDEYQDVLDKANSFKTELYEFEEKESTYSLPETLKNQYEYYCEFCQQIDNVVYGEYDESVYTKYYKAQYVFLNYPTRNRSEEYTLTEMQNNIDVSVIAVEGLENWINNEIKDLSNSSNKFQGFGNNVPSEFSGLYSYTVDFISSCENEIDYEQERMSSSLEKFDEDDRLYLIDPDETATSFVLYNLNEVIDISDMASNATIFENTYYVDMLAYCLNNE